MKKNFNHYTTWTAVVTPFTDDNRIDFASMERLLRSQSAAGNGILLLGSTGESLTLSEREKIEVLRLAIDLKLAVPLMVGVGGINIEQTSAWVETLESLAIDCYLMVTPLYAKPGDDGQYHWFKALLDRVTRPAMLYNIPGRTGKALSVEACQRLESHPNFWAIKEASGSVSDYTNYRAALSSIAIYSGDDGMVPYFALSGCHGVVSVASNIWPTATHRYVDLALAKELDVSALALWDQACKSLFSVSNPIPVKAILHEVGMIQTPQLRAPLAASDLKSRELLKKADAMVVTWNQGVR